MTEKLLPCPFCGEHLTDPSLVQNPKMGLARIHPGTVEVTGSCPIAGWGFYDEQLTAWNTRSGNLVPRAVLDEAVSLIERCYQQEYNPFEPDNQTQHFNLIADFLAEHGGGDA